MLCHHFYIWDFYICQLRLLSQIHEEESWPTATWRSLDLHPERTLPKICSGWLSLSSGRSLVNSRWCSCHYPFCLHLRQQPPHHQILAIYLSCVNWTQLWGKHDVDARCDIIERFPDINTIFVFSMTKPTYIWNLKPSVWTNKRWG